jgi:cyclic dehypoxanthinyl futalosine synthase
MGISREQALDCFASDDLIGIGMEADAVRRQMHPDGVVSYVIDRTIDYTGLVKNDEFGALLAEIEGALELGATGIRLVSGAASLSAMSEFEGMFAAVKARFPGVWLSALSTGELLALAKDSGLALSDAIVRLRDAGLDSVWCGDSETEGWLEVHRTAHRVGMKTTASVVFGLGETMEQRVAQFEAIRGLQEQTGGFTALTVSIAAPTRVMEEMTAVEYLKTLAVARMFLDNIENVQGSLPTQGLKVLQMGLRFGSNDVGSVLLEEHTRRVEGISLGSTEEELRRLIRDAGFRPVQRDTLYRTMFLN